MTDQRVLYIVACATPVARDVTTLVRLAQDDGWDVCVVATPSAMCFLNPGEIYLITGHPVRSNYKRPDEPDVLPLPDAIIVAPASFNTINKWSAGIADTLALGLVTEAVGLGLPIVAMPSLNAAQAKHPAFSRSLKELEASGVSVVYGMGVNEPMEPGVGRKSPYPWHLGLEALRSQPGERAGGQ